MCVFTTGSDFLWNIRALYSLLLISWCSVCVSLLAIILILEHLCKFDFMYLFFLH